MNAQAPKAKTKVMLRRSHTFTSARLQKRRRKIIIGKVVAALLCAGGLWGLVFWLSGLPAITIRDVQIQGAVSVSSTELASTTAQFLKGRYFFTVPKANIFFYPKNAIERNLLQAFPMLERATLRFKNFHTIGITVVERMPRALWCAESESAGKSKENCYVLQDTGLIFAEASSTPASFIRFYKTLSAQNPIGQEYESPIRFRALLQFADDVNALGLSVRAFRERPDTDVQVEIVGGGRLVVGRDADLVAAAANLHTIVSDPGFGGAEGFKELDYLDLRFGNKIFYRLK